MPIDANLTRVPCIGTVRLIVREIVHTEAINKIAT
jgi:hypothetical protein